MWPKKQWGGEEGGRGGLDEFYFTNLFCLCSCAKLAALYFQSLNHLHLLVRLNIYYFRDFGTEFKILGRKRLVILADFFSFLAGIRKI